MQWSSNQLVVLILVHVFLLLIIYVIESLFGTSFQAHVAQKNAGMPVQPECVPNQQVARKIKLAVDYPLVVIHQNL